MSIVFYAKQLSQNWLDKRNMQWRAPLVTCKIKHTRLYASRHIKRKVFDIQSNLNVKKQQDSIELYTNSVHFFDRKLNEPGLRTYFQYQIGIEFAFA